MAVLARRRAFARAAAGQADLADLLAASAARPDPGAPGETGGATPGPESQTAPPQAPTPESRAAERGGAYPLRVERRRADQDAAAHQAMAQGNTYIPPSPYESNPAKPRPVPQGGRVQDEPTTPDDMRLTPEQIAHIQAASMPVSPTHREYQRRLAHALLGARDPHLNYRLDDAKITGVGGGD